MRKFAVVTAAAAAVLVSRSAHAWNSYGHMEVAAVAWENMTTAIRAKAVALLQKNPNYDSWTSGVSAQDRDKFAFMKAATWPDAITFRSGYDDGDALAAVEVTAQIPKKSTTGQNIGYTDKLRHKYWHFVDTPFSPDGTKIVPADVPDAQTQIAACRDALAKNPDKDIRSYDSVWLLHLVGDVHQPVGTGTYIPPSPSQNMVLGNGQMVISAPIGGEHLVEGRAINVLRATSGLVEFSVH